MFSTVQRDEQKIHIVQTSLLEQIEPPEHLAFSEFMPLTLANQFPIICINETNNTAIAFLSCFSIK